MQFQEKILAIDAPYFYAGVTLINHQVVYTAPILGYMRGWRENTVHAYCKRKKWRYEKVENYAHQEAKDRDKPKGFEGRNNKIKGRRNEDNKSLY